MQQDFWVTTLSLGIMDAELKACLDEMVIAITSQIGLHVDRRLDTIDRRLDTIEQRLDTVDQRLDTVDRRLDTIDQRLGRIERRMGAVEDNLLTLNQRIDNLSDDMRQRFRVLNDRLAGAA